jgi:hypothetical protein
MRLLAYMDICEILGKHKAVCDSTHTNFSGIHTSYLNKYIVNYMEHTFMFTFQYTLL